MTQQLLKAAVFTDIHHGKKGNSETHNNDCSRFIDWFCDHVKQDPTIDHIMFLGDWFENRTAINISTLHYSYHNAKKLNELNLPVFFIVGNHDLYRKSSREIHSLINFNEFDNFKVIDTITIEQSIGKNGALLAPFLFKDEYEQLKDSQYLTLDTWWGHFEFKGFVITGDSFRMPSGPDPKDYVGPTHIFSGHFHKRQQFCNITYIGNTFAMSFNDIDDPNRGMMIYDHKTNKITFIDWDEQPNYTKTTLTDLLDGNVIINHYSMVKCIADIPISFEESQILIQKMNEKYSPRQLILEESQLLTDTLTNADTDEITFVETKDMIIKMLHDIESDRIDNSLLIQLFSDI